MSKAPGPAKTDAREQRVRRGLANPTYFGEAYLRPYDHNWIEALPPFAAEMLRFVHQTRRGCVVLPPEFLKTTLVSQLYALWRTYRATYFGELLRGMLVSEGEGLAKGNLSVISWHIEHNEHLAADFVDPKGRPLVFPDPEENVWNEGEIIVNRTGASKDPTWQAKGLDSRDIQGSRLDLLIADDLITPKNASSPAYRKKALDYWDLQFETRLVGTGQGIMCGNFNDARDLLSTLSRRPGYKVFKRPSVHTLGDQSSPPKESDLGNRDRVGLLWPQVWPFERLQEERRSKPNRFRRIHLLDERAEMGERLKVGWMQVLQLEQTPLRYSKFYFGVDPAPGAEVEDDPDFFNITVVALHAQGCDIVDVLDVRADTPRQVELLGIKFDQYQRMGRGVHAIGGAKVALDRYFRGAITIARPDLEPVLVEISIPGSKEERIEALGPYAQSGWLRCQEAAWMALTSDYNDQFQELSLFEQWKDFPHGTHDDKLDGVDVAVRTAREFEMVGDDEEYALEIAG